MRGIRVDVEALNEKVLRHMLDGESFGVTREVINKIKKTTAAGCKSAIRCGAPLVTIAPGALQYMRRVLDGRDIGRTGHGSPSEEVAAINELALMIAQKVAIHDPCTAMLWLNVNREGVEILQYAAVTELHTFSQWSDRIVLMRNGSNPAVWDQLLIGERIEDQRALTISQHAALQSLQVNHRGGAAHALFC